jgi:uncharacterized LabA/DUF88 family protein
VIGGIFVDGSSVIHSLKERMIFGEKERINYDALVKLLSERLGSKAEPVDFRFKHYYDSFRGNGDLVNRAGFCDILKRSGWVVYEMQAKLYADGHYEDKQVDISMALDAYHIAFLKQIQVLVIVTHDSDFTALLKRVPPNIKKAVVGWSDGMAKELDQVAEGIFLDVIWQKVRWKENGK